MKKVKSTKEKSQEILSNKEPGMQPSPMSDVAHINILEEYTDNQLDKYVCHSKFYCNS